MRGRKPKPMALKILEGERHQRINFNEPVLPTSNLDPPTWLRAEAVEHWRELAPMLSKAGLLSEGDRHGLAMMCDDYRKIVADPDVENSKARDRYRRMLTEFGLTPSSRSRIRSTVERPKDALEEFLAG